MVGLKVHLIGVIYNGKNTVGFRILDFDNKKTMDIPYNNAMAVVKSGQANIVGLEVDKGKLVGNNGKLDRYPKIIGAELKDNNNIIVLKQVGDEGYTVSDWQGNIRSYKNSDLITLANQRNMQIANGKIVRRTDGTEFISAIYGEYEKQDLPKQSQSIKVERPINKVEEDKIVKQKEKNSLTAEEKIARLSGVDINRDRDTEYSGVKLRDTVIAAPKISGNATDRSISRLKEVDEEHGMTIEQKMAKGMLTIRGIRSFYYAVLSTIKKIETNEVPTMGVSVDTLYYNPEFVKGLSLPELVFVEIHEVCHLAMRHRQRQGSRIHKIWNIACDLYINKLICEEFGIKPGDDPIYPIEDKAGCGIQFAAGGLYNPDININTETPERIYEEILEAAKQEAKQNQQGQGQGQNQQGDGAGKQGQSSGGEHGEESGDQTEEIGQDISNEEIVDESGEESGDNKGKANGKQEDGGDKEEEGEEGQGESTNKMKDLADAAEDSKFRGKKIGKLKIVDVIDDAKSAAMDDTQKQNTVRTILERAVVLQKQNTGAFGGEQGSWMERYVEDVLAPRINWRSLIKNKLTLASQKITTYAKPDKRFLTRGRVLPGPKKVENDQLDNVKICIDTSGSIGDKELGIAMAQIKQLLKVYNAKAELMYWDTEVRVCEPFNNVQELLKIMPGGGGGTDVNCVFEQFEGRDYKTGKKQKPSIIIIFTDGYFGTVDDKYKKYKDTIWIIEGNQKFEPPFGVMAQFKYDEK